MSLRTQINLRILVIGILILSLGGSFAIWQARTSVSREISSSLNLASRLIQMNLSEQQQGRFDINVWLPRFVSLEQTRHLKIQLQKANGEIVKFTATHATEEDDAPPDWFVTWVTQEYTQIKQPLETADGQSVLFIQANPLDEIAEAWQEGRAFFASLVLMTLLILLAVHAVFNKLFIITSEVESALQEIEQGHYYFKLPSYSIQEFDRIASAINHLTEVLNSAREQNRALTLHSLEIQEEERQFLAKELHDELGQSLTGIKVMLITTKQARENFDAMIDSITGICDHLIDVVRSMMRSLHPLVLRELGLRAALEDLINHWAARNPELSIALDCDEGVDNLDSKMTIHIFRIIQECLTNIMRHAQARHARIELHLIDDKGRASLRLRVVDDGKGCDANLLQSGFGLLGIRERLTMLNGEMSIDTEPGKGMQIGARIPLSQN